MDVLIACEYSGRVRDAFAARGHFAVSCDILPTEAPGEHYQGDVLDLLDLPWDLLIGFPPCTHLAVSGARYFAEKRADGRQQAAEAFFLALANAPIPKIAIENPIGIMSRRYRKPDQIVHPWQFGHDESKATCLWLRGLPPRVATDVLELPACGYWTNQTPSRQSNAPESKDRAKLRSATYPGIAAAMAATWG